MFVSILKPLSSIMSLLHMKLKMILIFKMLLTNFTFMVLLDDSLVPEEFELVLNHAKVIESALISIFEHLNTISGEQWINFRFYSINYVLRM